MSRLRILYNNSADQASSLVASSTAGGLVASNLLTDIKSQVWRSTSTTATLTLQWAAGKLLGLVALPFCNFSASATIRVQLYTEPADVTPVLDTGVQPAAAYTPLGLWNWGYVPMGVNAYSYSGATYAVIWFTVTSAKKCVITLDDSTNTLGYLEASRLVAGSYWEAEVNPDWGASLGVTDRTENFRNDAGDLLSDRGSIHKSLNLPLSQMTTADRAAIFNILRGNGLNRPMFVSVYPELADSTLDQEHQVYGKLAKSSSIASANYAKFASTLEIEEL